MRSSSGATAGWGIGGDPGEHFSPTAGCYTGAPMGAFSMNRGSGWRWKDGEGDGMNCWEHHSEMRAFRGSVYTREDLG